MSPNKVSPEGVDIMTAYRFSVELASVVCSALTKQSKVFIKMETVVH